MLTQGNIIHSALIYNSSEILVLNMNILVDYIIPMPCNLLFHFDMNVVVFCFSVCFLSNAV